jgi:hypothetical protein
MVWCTAPPRMPSPLVISSTMLGSVGDSRLQRRPLRKQLVRRVGGRPFVDDHNVEGIGGGAYQAGSRSSPERVDRPGSFCLVPLGQPLVTGCLVRHPIRTGLGRQETDR